VTRAAVLRLADADPVGVALVDFAPGMALGISDVVAATAIPRGHKVALRDLRDGETIRKFGLPIGVASGSIAVGSHVHTHNLVFRPPEPHAAARRGSISALRLAAMVHNLRVRQPRRARRLQADSSAFHYPIG
jgi:hypothetical protein